MQVVYRIGSILLLALAMLCCEQPPERILVFSKTEGFRHASIADGKMALLRLGAEMGVKVDTTEEAHYFHPDSLRQYQAVVFLNTTGDVLNDEQQAAFEQYIQSGGGYVGIHAATDTEYDWPWYGKLAGAYFDGHPGNPNVREGQVTVVDNAHPATQGLPETWVKRDEFYDFKDLNTDVHTLITVDEASYNWDKMGDFHPLAWYHEYDGGRAFYTNFGHTKAAFSEPLMLKHLKGGLAYAMGKAGK